MVYVYEYNSEAQQRDGYFRSYYVKDDSLFVACIAHYTGGRLAGDMFHFVPDSVLRTKYSNVQYDDVRKEYAATVEVYGEHGELKERSVIRTADQLDLGLIEESATCCFEHIDVLR